MTHIDTRQALIKATTQLISMQSLVLASEHNGHKPSKSYPSYLMFQEALNDLQNTINAARKALDMSNDWIEWNGEGGCPAPRGVMTEVKFRSGKTYCDNRPEGWCWKWYNDESDIVAYRVVK